MKHRNTTWTWPQKATDEDRRAHREWLDAHFEGNWEPSAEGGFRDLSYGDGMTECRSCGALIMKGYQDISLNRHRAWHDKNDREGTSD